MRAFDGKMYYAMPMSGLMLNTQGGPRRNENAEVLDTNGNPIPHLYSAGEMGGITSCMYQGGTNIAECIIFGEIAWHERCGREGRSARLRRARAGRVCAHYAGHGYRSGRRGDL